MRSALRHTFSSCKRCSHFSESRTDVHDEQRTGWPSVISDALLQRTEEAIRGNRRLRVKELHQIIPEVSMTTLYEVVTVKLGYRKLCARWVPKMLTEEHKKKRMGFALNFLTRYAEASDEFLDHIVTGDKTWVYHHTPESKKQPMQMAPFEFTQGQEMQNFDFSEKNHGFCFFLTDFCWNLCLPKQQLMLLHIARL
ncbi:uncharacterized protein TNCV_806771 [Trichonephila clavipes]|nr:uncharacterized protein TNCV_806771 [Trichonephila clavipes]